MNEGLKAVDKSAPPATTATMAHPAAVVSSKTGTMTMIHRIRQIPVIYHDDGEVCPLSKGESTCPHATAETGQPSFEDSSDLEQLSQVPNLRKLAGCFDVIDRLATQLPNGLNGLIKVPNLATAGQVSWSDLADDPKVMELLRATLSAQMFDGSSSLTSGYRADSGVGDSIEGTGSHQLSSSSGYFMGNNHLGGSSSARDPSEQSPLFPADIYAGDYDEDFDEDNQHHHQQRDRDQQQQFEEDSQDTVRPLPNRKEFRRYERKQKIGAQFLTNVTPQQLQTMSPELKQSMEQFVQQIEAHAGVRSHNSNAYK